MIPFDVDDQDEPEPRQVGAAHAGSHDMDNAAWEKEKDDAASDGSGAMQQIHQYLVELSKDELVALVERLAVQDATIRQVLVQNVVDARGLTADLLRGARATIDNISAEAIYAGDEPSGGELERLRDRLDTLVARGHADDVLLLCQRLLRRADRAVEAMEETDDGFFSAIHRVLEVIPEALARSSKSPVEQMLWLYDLESSQDYGLFPGMAEFWAEDRPAEVWNELADRIEKRLYPAGPDRPPRRLIGARSHA